MGAKPAFVRTLQSVGARTMIHSVCSQCGESRLLSAHDESLQEWENSHRCAGSNRKQPSSVPDPASHAERA